MSENGQTSVPAGPPEIGTAPIRPAGRGELAFYALCRAISVGLSRVVFPGPVLGREHLPRKGPYVLAPSHRSNIDWLIVARVTRRRLRYIVKGEVWKVRAAGRLLEALGAFPVRRGVADREAFKRALEVLEAGEPLVVFPEGTRHAGAELGELREGAAYLALRAGVPIVPLGVAGTEAAMPRGSRLPRPTRVRVVVGPPITTAVPVDGAPVGRIARSATHALNAELRAALQAAFDAAGADLGGARLGSPGGAPGEPESAPGEAGEPT